MNFIRIKIYSIAWLACLFFLLCTIPSLSAQVIKIENQSNTGLIAQFPINPTKAFTKTELIYLASEINLSENKELRSISFFQQGITRLENLKVYLKNSDSDALWNGTWNLTGFTKVFDGTVDNYPHKEKLTIELQHPFLYDHTKNLQIAFEQDGHELVTYSYSNLYHPRFWVTTGVYPSKSRWISDTYERTDLFYYQDIYPPHTYTYSRPNVELEFTDEIPQISTSVDGAISVSEAWFFDSGGSQGGYLNNEVYTLVMSPQEAGRKLVAEMKYLDIEGGGDCTLDRLIVYDGATTAAPALGVYCNGNLPDRIQATNSEGKLCFRFVSGSSQVGEGWSMYVYETNQTLEVDAGTVEEACSECEVTLGGDIVINNGVAPYTFEWSPSEGVNNTTSERPVAKPNFTTTYTLKVTDALGNVGEDTVTVRRGHKCHEVMLGTLDDLYGGSTTYSCEYPINRKFSYNRQEVLYTKQEIEQAGRIRKLRFYKVFNDENIPIENLEIYMKHTTATKLSNANSLDLTGYTKVFTGRLENSEPGGSWLEIELNEAFDYDNVNNLQIAVKQGWQEPLKVCAANAIPAWAVTLTCCDSYLRACWSDVSNEGNLISQEGSCCPIRPDAQLLIEDDEPTYYTRKDITFIASHGRFYDSGGPKKDYTDDECYEVTFYPSEADKALCFDFVHWDVQSSEDCQLDVLEVFDGPSTAFPSLGRYCGDLSPGQIHSTHPSGALTFVYYSDGEVVQSGWEAIIKMEDNRMIADAGPDQTICSACSVQLGGTPIVRGGDGFGYTYSWAPAESLNDATAAYPLASPQQTTTYQLTVTDRSGNTATDEVTVHVIHPSDDIVIGTPGATFGSGCYPINRMYGYSQVEMLYTASEIGQEGQINAISFFKIYNDQNIPIENVEIYMKHTSENYLTSVAGVDYSGYQKVFGTVSSTLPNTQTGYRWITIDLDEPFYYNGADNLLISFKTGPQAAVTNVYHAPYWSQTYTSVPMVRSRFQNDYEVGALYAPASNDAYQKFRPDIHLEIENPDKTSLLTDHDAVFTMTPGAVFLPGNGPDGVKLGAEYAVLFLPETEDDFVSINFTGFNLLPSDNCEEEYMEIYDGPDEHAPLIGRFCGLNSPGVVTSTDPSGTLFIKVKISETSSPVPRHWNGTYAPGQSGVQADAGGIIYTCLGCVGQLGGVPAARGGTNRNYSYLWNGGPLAIKQPTIERPTFINNLPMGQAVQLQVTDGDGNQATDVAQVVVAAPESDVEIGADGTAELTQPVDRWEAANYSEIVYKADEINFGGYLTSISFYQTRSSNTEDVIKNLEVYMKSTSDGAFTAGDMKKSSYRKVFEGSVLVPTGEGWVTIRLDEPFFYRADKNLGIAIRHEQSIFNGTIPTWKGQSTGNESLMRFSTGVGASGLNLQPSTDRPAVKLHFDNRGNLEYQRLSYAELLRKPGGGIFPTTRHGKLRFTYHEKYYVGSSALLDYTIWDDDYNRVAGTPYIPIRNGINYLELDLRAMARAGAALEANKIYLLEVKGEKGDRRVLKFQYVDGMSPTASVPN